MRGLLWAGLVAIAAGSGLAHAATGQVAVGEGSNWPYSSLAQNPVDGVAYGIWRRSACTTVSYNLLRWNGSNFAAVANGQFGEDGALDVPSFDCGYDYVSLAIDSLGGFHVAFSGSSGNGISGPRGVFYAYRSATGTSWTHSIVESFSHPNGWRNSQHPKIQVDSANRPHIAYQYSDVSASPRIAKVRYAYFNGTSWALRDAFSQTGDNNEIGSTDIALDSNNKAHVIWKAEINGSGLDGVLYYANNVSSAVGGAFGSALALSTGGTSAPEGNSMSMVVDAANRVHLVQSNSQGRLIYYNNVSGSFTSTWINNSLTGWLDGDSLSQNASGTLYLTYVDGLSLKYAFLPGGTGSTWTTGTHITGTFDTANYFSGVIVDSGAIYALYDNGDAPRNLWFASGQATAPPPSVSISVTPTSVAEDGSSNLVYTVTRSAVSASALTVNLSTTGTATPGTDFTGNAATVTIAANATTASVTINPTSDTTVEANETVIVAVTSGTGYSIGSPASATGTITDNDLPAATIAVAPTAVDEDGTTNLVYTVTLSQPPVVATSVNYTVGGTATNGTDFGTIASPLAFPIGATSRTVTVNPTADTTVEANESVILTLANGTGYTVVNPSSATGTITNDDLPSLSINDVVLIEGNSGTTNFVFTVSLSAPAGTGGVGFNIATANGTATAGSDYTSQSLSSQTIPAGSSSYTFTVQVTGDALNEPNETFFVNVSGVTNAELGDGQGQGTINNDDPQPSLSIADVAQAEGNSGSTNATFTVSLSAASGQTVGVSYATVNGTAGAPGDYTASSGTLSFTPGQVTRTFVVPIIGDTTPESDETFTVNLSGASNATIGDGSGTGTIQNDDALPVLSIADATVTEGNAGTTTLSFALSLDIPAPGAVGYSIATADVTATAPADYVARSLSGQSIATGQSSATFTVTVNGDTSLEADETLRVLLSNVTGATVGDAEGIGTIRSDDYRVLRLVDSGQVNCTDASADTGTVSAATPDPEAVGYNEQDCTRGASAADAMGRMAKIGASSARGRDYTKIANDGSELPASATQGPNPGDWGCTRDNLTGLTWELKVNNAASLRHVGHRYTWYETDPRINGGDPGSVGTAGTCNSTLAQCNTSAYRNAINALSGTARLCGATDWRLPTPVEMRSLVDSGFDRSTPPIDSLWFPNENGAGYWTDTSFAFIPSGAWSVSFIAGSLTANLKSNVDAVRLVRGAP